ncbi:MAG TPA: DUF3618 domain-containing protein [Candidatus Lumbricidophila sp.]|nr:DUF3618 domain-containing protein [Candidatus Lumbricidophila sp.]
MGESDLVRHHGTSRNHGAVVVTQSRSDAARRARNLTRLEAREATEQARADLVATLNALEDKLNVPKQVAKKAEAAKAKARGFAETQPAAALGIVLGVAALAIGGITWAIVRAVRN